MLYLLDNETNPYWNLAAEEYLLLNFEEPIFRLWQNDNAIIVGRYQNSLAEIDYDFVKKNNIKVVRRITGGGAVFHDLGNVNFTFIDKKINGEDASAMFKRFTKPILEAINSLGVHAYLEGRNDLLIDGSKFSGNAICVHNDRVLQHGTLLYSACISNLSSALLSRQEKFIGKYVKSTKSRVTNISSHLKEKLSPKEFQQYIFEHIMSKYNGEIYNYTKEDIEGINKLFKEKYSQDSWNFGHSPNFSFNNTKKFSGGLLEFYFDVNKGDIDNLKIFGDYFFTSPTEEFINLMNGTPHIYNVVEDKLNAIDNMMLKKTPLGIKSFFNGIDKEDILDMFFN